MKISIIVPVYNGEKYLQRCLDSILAQTYDNWELLIVDDGSTDATWRIISQYAEREKRIVAIHQENGGPGAARNTAIEKIGGDYVVFVDADDYIASDYLELLQPLAEKHDVVCIDVVQTNPEGRVLKEEKMSVYQGWARDRIVKAMMTGCIPWGGVRKAVSAKILAERQIRYSNLKVGEEALFSFCVLHYAKSVGFLDSKAVYTYELHDGSQSSFKIDDPWGGTYEVIRAYLKENGLYSTYAAALNAFNVASTVVSIDKITQLYRGKERRQKVKSRFQVYKERQDKRYPVDKGALSYKAKIFLPFLKFNLVFPIVWASKLRG